MPKLLCDQGGFSASASFIPRGMPAQDADAREEMAFKVIKKLEWEVEQGELADSPCVTCPFMDLQGSILHEPDVFDAVVMEKITVELHCALSRCALRNTESLPPPPLDRTDRAVRADKFNRRLEDFAIKSDLISKEVFEANEKAHPVEAAPPAEPEPAEPAPADPVDPLYGDWS